MLPTFVIGLREGLEAALIVGIIAAFLRKQGRADLIRQLALGVAAAVSICTAVGVGLELWSRALPQRQQEGLETVIAILAVGMVTYMVLWMKEHSRGLRSELESMAAGAIGGHGRAGLAMVAMAFLAVLREGFETAVFLLAAFNESGSGVGAAVGALAGIAVAVVVGYGIYRGGVRLNLSRFFRATGLVLVLVAGGLLVSALHTAHEAGWLDTGQHRMLDLSWLVQPGSVTSSVLTGMLGIQPYPVLVEVVGWLVYVVPLGLFVAWPPGRAVRRRGVLAALTGAAVTGLAVALLLVATTPSGAPSRPVLRSAELIARVVGTPNGDLVLRTASQHPLAGTTGAVHDVVLQHTGTMTVAGVLLDTYRATFSSADTGPATLPVARVAALNGGRLPLGVTPRDSAVAARYVRALTVAAAVEPSTERVVRLRSTEQRRAVVTGSSGQAVMLTGTFAHATRSLPHETVRASVAAASADLARAASRANRIAWAWLSGLLGGAAAVALLGVLTRRRAPAVTVSEPTHQPAVSRR